MLSSGATESAAIYEQCLGRLSKIYNFQDIELELERYFYLNTINLSDNIIMIKITIYFNLYKHDLKI